MIPSITLFPRHYEDIRSLVDYTLSHFEEYFAKEGGWDLSEFLSNVLTFRRLTYLIQMGEANFDDSKPQAENYAALLKRVVMLEQAVLSDPKKLAFVETHRNGSGETTHAVRRYVAMATAAGALLPEALRAEMAELKERFAELASRSTEVRKAAVAAVRFTLPAEGGWPETVVTGDNWERLIDEMPLQSQRQKIQYELNMARDAVTPLTMEMSKVCARMAQIMNQATGLKMSWAGWQSHLAGSSIGVIRTVLQNTYETVLPAARREIKRWKEKSGLNHIYGSDYGPMTELDRGASSEGGTETVPMHRVLEGLIQLLWTKFGLKADLESWEHYSQGVLLLRVYGCYKFSNDPVYIILDLVARPTKDAAGRFDPLQVVLPRIGMISMNIDPDTMTMSREDIGTLLHEVGHGMQLALVRTNSRYHELVAEYSPLDTEVGSLAMEHLLLAPEVQEMMGLKPIPVAEMLRGEASLWAGQVLVSRFFMALFNFDDPEAVSHGVVEAERKQLMLTGPYDEPEPDSTPWFSYVHAFLPEYQGLYAQYIMALAIAHSVSELARQGYMEMMTFMYELGALHEGDYVAYLRQNGIPIDLGTFGRLLATVE